MVSERLQRMNFFHVTKRFTQPGFYPIAILCGLALTFSGCATTTQRDSPPSPQKVEVQLLQTLETAETLGDGNPLLLSSLYSLAAYYQEQGEVGKAEYQYKRALTLKEQVSGPEHPDVAMILHNYAGLLREAHRYQEAENLSARANAILAKRSPVPTSP